MVLTGRATNVLQWRPLQLEGMKLESLVIADQNAAVNTFPGLVHTACQTMRVDFTQSR